MKNSWFDRLATWLAEQQYAINNWFFRQRATVRKWISIATCQTFGHDYHGTLCFRCFHNKLHDERE